MAVNVGAARRSRIAPKRTGKTRKAKRKSPSNSYRKPGLWRDRVRSVTRLFSGLFAACLAAVFFIGLSVGLLAGYRWLTSTEYFSLKKVEVTGVDRLDYDAVIKASGLRRGMNSLELNMEEVRAGVLTNPWVESATIKRVLPDGVRIAVTERVPAFWVAEGEQLLYADARGRIIAPVASDLNNGEGGERLLRSLPVLRMGSGAEPMMDRLPAFMAAIRSPESPFSLLEPAWVRLSAGDGMEMFFEEEQRIVRIGTERWDGNVRRLRQVWRDLDGRGELDQVRTIRAHGANVWVVKGDRARRTAMLWAAAKGGEA